MLPNRKYNYSEIFINYGQFVKSNNFGFVEKDDLSTYTESSPSSIITTSTSTSTKRRKNNKMKKTKTVFYKDSANEIEEEEERQSIINNKMTMIPSCSCGLFP